MPLALISFSRPQIRSNLDKHFYNMDMSLFLNLSLLKILYLISIKNEIIPEQLHQHA